MRKGRTLVLVVVACAWMGGEVLAQTCGDADASGAITVTDGVQTLRASAGLSTSCTAGRCDVDGSGSITVTDGVNVLRKAAGITIAEACPTASVNESVRGVIGEMTKIARLTVGTSAAASAVTGAVTTDCTDGGFIELDGQKSTFVDCRFGDLVINGAITTTNILSDPDNGRFIRSDVYEQYQVQFLDSSFTFRQDGTSRIEIDTKKNKLIEDGTLTIFTSQSATGQDEYTLTKVNLTTDIQTATVMSGQLISALAAAGLAGIKAVTLGFVTGDIADVDVEFDDGHFEAFKFNITSGELTPASLAALGGWAVLREREEVDPPRGSWLV